MNITVVNGSPKGKYSITLQSALYLQKAHKDDKFEFLQVGQLIKRFEQDMTPALDAINRADLVLFIYPVYTCLATAQLHRFIELLFDSKTNFSGKFATQFSTSKHFYDNTAHKYVEANLHDLGFKYIKGMSADMDDLTKSSGREELSEFYDFVKYSVAHGLVEAAQPPSQTVNYAYTPYLAVKDKVITKNVMIVTNAKPTDATLLNMITDFRNALPTKTEIFNVAEFPFKGGCIGCLNCTADGQCIYKDGFSDVLRTKIDCADAVVFAFSIKNHSMGADFKRFDDRRFCNGHRTLSEGMPVGYLVNGDLSAEPNLVNVIEGRAEIGRNYLAGVATSKDGVTSVTSLVDKLTYALEHKLVLPQNFLGVGGRLIFRDLVYVMQGIMKADHKFYKTHGIYDDMPQKQRGRRIAMKLVGPLFNNKEIRRKMGAKMNESMLMAYKKAIDNIDK